MAHHLTGWTAIQYAEKHGGTLKKYNDPTERALKRVSIEKAKRVAREDPRLIYMDVPSGRRNPHRKLTKLQRKVRAAKASANRRVAVALAKYLKQVNPSATHAKVQKLRGGVIKITPIRAKRRAGRK